MKNLLSLFMIFLMFAPMSVNAQEEKKEKKKTNIIKEFYQDFLKYGTVYAAGDIRNSYEPSRREYFVRTNQSGNIFDIPQIVEVTEYNPFDYRIGVGIRKLARFDYERKPGNFWTGNADRERQIALSAPTSAVKGFEYLFHWEKERQRGEVWTNSRYFLRHTGKYHIAKIESRKQGAFDFEYKSAEVRARLPIGKKFSLSAGAIFRTHQRAYGYNPFEIWVNETNSDGTIANYWYTLGYDRGYTDQWYESTWTDQDGNDQSSFDYFWLDPDGNRVADSDLEFRDGVFRDLINDYNNEIWDGIGEFGLVSPIVGVDFYHYTPKFWAHAYANWLLPYHSYVMGDGDFNYGNRNNWGKGGLRQDSEFEQWDDYQFGGSIGWKLSKSFGIFVEGEYTKMWASEFFNSTFGFNYTFR
jgi:hypothetical protein